MAIYSLDCSLAQASVLILGRSSPKPPREEDQAGGIGDHQPEKKCLVIIHAPTPGSMNYSKIYEQMVAYAQLNVAEGRATRTVRSATNAAPSIVVNFTCRVPLSPRGRRRPRFSKFENVTQIVIGRSRRGVFAELFHRSLPHELIRRVEDIAIHLVTGRNESASWLSGRVWRWPTFDPVAFLWSTIAVAAVVRCSPAG